MMMKKRAQHDAVQAKRDKANHAQSEDARETIEQAVEKAERCSDAEAPNCGNHPKRCKQQRRERLDPVDVRKATAARTASGNVVGISFHVRSPSIA